MSDPDSTSDFSQDKILLESILPDLKGSRISTNDLELLDINGLLRHLGDDWLASSREDMPSMMSFSIPASIKRLIRLASGHFNRTQVSIVILGLQKLFLDSGNPQKSSENKGSIQGLTRPPSIDEEAWAELEGLSPDEAFEKIKLIRFRRALGISDELFEFTKLAISLKDYKKWLKTRQDYLRSLPEKELEAEGYFMPDSGSIEHRSYHLYKQVVNRMECCTKRLNQSNEEFEAHVVGEFPEEIQRGYWQYKNMPKDERLFQA